MKCDGVRLDERRLSLRPERPDDRVMALMADMAAALEQESM